MSTNFNSLRRSVLVVLALFALTAVATADGPAYDSFYVFGDSLADNGNIFIQTRALGLVPAVPPSESPNETYFLGRFSNGPVAFEYLWQRISGQPPGSPGALTPYLASPFAPATAALDFAFGGTGTDYFTQTPGGFYSPGLKGQIELFRFALRGRSPSPHALFALVTGANDYRDDPFNEPKEPEQVVRNISDAVRRLYELGARNIVVLNLPDLSLIPANRNPDGSPSEFWSALSSEHNRLLLKSLTKLARHLPGIKLVHVDTNADELFDLLPRDMDRMTPALDVLFPPDILNFPPEFRMSLCLFIDPGTCADVPTPPGFNVGSAFLFWDAVHPTTEAHRILADYIYSGLQ
jgi:phospholipase/lecithinase/hemolysin